jgi:hypothetical protein
MDGVNDPPIPSLDWHVAIGPHRGRTWFAVCSAAFLHGHVWGRGSGQRRRSFAKIQDDTWQREQSGSEMHVC